MNPAWYSINTVEHNNIHRFMIHHDKLLDNIDVIDSGIRTISSIPPPFNLLCSGGSDSQAMLYIWKKAKVDFIVHTALYVINNQVMNRHDIKELEQWAMLTNTPIIFHYIDLDYFLNHELIHYAKKYTCTSPQLCTHMKISDTVLKKFKGTIVFSGNYGPIALYDGTIHGLDRYAQETTVIPFFFQHSLELASAVHNICVHTKNTIQHTTSYDLKIKSMNQAGIPIIPQPDKQTGFEIVKEHYDHLTISKLEKVKYAGMPSKRPFDIAFRYRLTDKIKYDDNVVWIER